MQQRRRRGDGRAAARPAARRVAAPCDRSSRAAVAVRAGEVELEREAPIGEERAPSRRSRRCAAASRRSCCRGASRSRRGRRGAGARVLRRARLRCRRRRAELDPFEREEACTPRAPMPRTSRHTHAAAPASSRSPSASASSARLAAGAQRLTNTGPCPLSQRSQVANPPPTTSGPEPHGTAGRSRPRVPPHRAAIRRACSRSRRPKPSARRTPRSPRGRVAGARGRRAARSSGMSQAIPVSCRDRNADSRCSLQALRDERGAAELELRHRVEIVEHARQRVEVLEQRRRRLAADAGTPGTLSTASPISARKSAIRSGITPKRSSMSW